jgi:hypothetical protein
MENEGRIFISYRRDASQWHAFSIYYALKEVHNRLVFFDLVSMGGGDFEQMIFDAIDGSRHFILILSKNTLHRCTEENDFLKKEIKRAFKKNRNIVPIFFDDFNFSDQHDLLHQTELQRLGKCNGLEISPGVFSECVERLNKKFLVGHFDIVEEDKKSPGEIIKYAVKAASLLPDYSEAFLTPSPNRTSYISGTADFWKLNEEEENQLDRTLKSFRYPGLYYGSE